LAQSADQAVLLAGIAGFRMAYLQLGPPEKDAVVAAQQRWLIASL